MPNIESKEIPTNASGFYVNDVDFLGKVNLSKITGKSQYWKSTKQKKKCEKLEKSIHNFGKTIFMLHSMNSGINYKIKLNKQFKELKDNIISVQKSADLSKLETIEDVKATKKLNDKLNSIMKEIHKTEKYFEKHSNESYRTAFSGSSEKSKIELERFQELTLKLEQIEMQLFESKPQTSSIPLVRSLLVLFTEIFSGWIQNHSDRINLFADHKINEKEKAFDQIVEQTTEQVCLLMEKIPLIENSKLLKSFTSIFDKLEINFKQAEKINKNLLKDSELDALKKSIDECKQSFKTRINDLETAEMNRKEEEKKMEIAALVNWKFSDFKQKLSEDRELLFHAPYKVLFPNWQNFETTRIFIYLNNQIRKCGKQIQKESNRTELSNLQKETIIKLEGILDSLIAVENLPKIQNTRQVENALTLAKELKKLIDAISLTKRSVSDEKKLKEFKHRMLSLKKGMELINDFPVIDQDKTFNFKTSRLNSRPGSTIHEENLKLLKQAERYLIKFKKSYAALYEGIKNIEVSPKTEQNPVILEQLKSRLNKLNAEFKETEIEDFIDKTEKQLANHRGFLYFDHDESDCRELRDYIQKIADTFKRTKELKNKLPKKYGQ